MRIYMVSDGIGEWIDKWAEKEGDGGFQDKAAQIKNSEVTMNRVVKLIRLVALDDALEALQAYREAESDE